MFKDYCFIYLQTPEEWHTILYFAAAIYCFGSIIYAALASGKIQSWALVGQEQVFLSENEQSQTSTEDIPIPAPRYQAVH